MLEDLESSSNLKAFYREGNCYGTSLVVLVRSLVRELDTTCHKKDQRFCMTQLRPGAAKYIYVIQLHHIQITKIYSPPVQFSRVQLFATP